ncbi:MAG: hypothetical protein J7621_14025 [Niastella sp.]|nr:hypothetical protein [Niastella sp.]
MNILYISLLTLSGLLQLNVNPKPTFIAADQYCNARFGYCINYPAAVLTPQEEAQNGDGRRFTNKRGEVILTVFGRLNQDANGDPMTLQQQFAQDVTKLEKASASTVISYKKKGTNFYVLSGTKGSKIFYHKMIIKEDAFCFALLEYPKADKQTYDVYSKVVFDTFK